jgi:hypothetical protein
MFLSRLYILLAALIGCSSLLDAASSSQTQQKKVRFNEYDTVRLVEARDTSTTHEAFPEEPYGQSDDYSWSTGQSPLVSVETMRNALLNLEQTAERIKLHGDQNIASKAAAWARCAEGTLVTSLKMQSEIEHTTTARETLLRTYQDRITAWSPSESYTLIKTALRSEEAIASLRTSLETKQKRALTSNDRELAKFYTLTLDEQNRRNKLYEAEIKSLSAVKTAASSLAGALKSAAQKMYQVEELTRLLDADPTITTGGALQKLQAMPTTLDLNIRYKSLLRRLSRHYSNVSNFINNEESKLSELLRQQEPEQTSFTVTPTILESVAQGIQSYYSAVRKASREQPDNALLQYKLAEAKDLFKPFENFITYGQGTSQKIIDLEAVNTFKVTVRNNLATTLATHKTDTTLSGSLITTYKQEALQALTDAHQTFVNFKTEEMKQNQALAAIEIYYAKLGARLLTPNIDLPELEPVPVEQTSQGNQPLPSHVQNSGSKSEPKAPSHKLAYGLAAGTVAALVATASAGVAKLVKKAKSASKPTATAS